MEDLRPPTAAVGFDGRWPRQMPMIGSLPRIRVSSSGMQPASLGVPGPGSISTGLSMVPRRSISACAGTELR